ncbi:MAG: major facilitator superfamily 1 [Rubritepida sp.]|nr:major facilitator superfamily 1 [Rubritepida sp.]
MPQSESPAGPGGELMPGVRRGTLPMMAAACGVMVGNIYICQPLLDAMAQSFGVPERVAGGVAVAAQLGYALGILLVVPLADMVAPRRLVRWLMAVTTLGLLGAAVVPVVGALVVASAVIAAATVVPQILIPIGASMVPVQRRGRVIGMLQTGLILGILLSRTVSGAVATAAGSWRASYLFAAILTAILFLALPAFMPAHVPASRRRSYPALLASLPGLLAHRALRISAALGFCIFGAFSAFWATLAFHLATPHFGYGAAAVGLFGLWGAPGAVLAPMGGRLADRFGPDAINAGALACVVAAFLVAGTAGSVSVIALVVAVNLLDFGMQSGQVANQVRIFGLGDDIRARLNTVYMVAVFSGGAFGSFVGVYAWSVAGWTGVCTLAGAFVALGAIILAGTSLRPRISA